GREPHWQPAWWIASRSPGHRRKRRNDRWNRADRRRRLVAAFGRCFLLSTSSIGAPTALPRRSRSAQAPGCARVGQPSHACATRVVFLAGTNPVSRRVGPDAAGLSAELLRLADGYYAVLRQRRF